MSVSNTPLTPISYVLNKAGISAYSGTEPVEVPVGSDGQILSSQSSASSGLSWISTNLGTARYSPIASGSVTSGVTEILISSITGGYKNLFVEIEGSAVSVVINTVPIRVVVNSDTTASYNRIEMVVRTNALFGNYAFGDTDMIISGALMGTVGYTSGSIGTLQLIFSNYADTLKYKTMAVRRNHTSSWTGASSNRMHFGSHIWKNTSAITSLKIICDSGSFRDGTSYKVYVY
jgi:hypothetical protein